MRCVLLGVLVGCGGAVSAESWGEDAALAMCDFQEKCDAAEFYGVYDSKTSCESLTTSYWEGIADYLATCSFAEDKAQICIDGLKGSCPSWAVDSADLLLSCSQAFDCDDEGYVFVLDPDPAN